LGKETVQNLVNHQMVFLLKAGMRDALHDAELFVGAGQ
jgi:hypothetical protein